MAEGEPDAPDDGPLEPLGVGMVDGAGVSSGGPPSTDGTADAGVDGTGPRPPDVAQPAVAIAATSTMIGSGAKERWRRAGMWDALMVQVWSG